MPFRPKEIPGQLSENDQLVLMIEELEELIEQAEAGKKNSSELDAKKIELVKFVDQNIYKIDMPLTMVVDDLIEKIDSLPAPSAVERVVDEPTITEKTAHQQRLDILNGTTHPEIKELLDFIAAIKLDKIQTEELSKAIIEIETQVEFIISNVATRTTPVEQDYINLQVASVQRRLLALSRELEQRRGKETPNTNKVFFEELKQLSEELLKKLSAVDYDPTADVGSLEIKIELALLIHGAMGGVDQILEAAQLQKNYIEPAQKLLVDLEKRIVEIETKWVKNQSEYIALNNKIKLPEPDNVVAISVAITEITALKVIFENTVTLDLSNTKKSVAQGLLNETSGVIDSLTKKKEKLTREDQALKLRALLANLQADPRNIASTSLDELRILVAQVEANIQTVIQMGDTVVAQEWQEKLIEPSNQLLIEAANKSFENLPEVTRVKNLIASLTPFINGSKLFENEFNGRPTAKNEAAAKVKSLADAIDALGLLAGLSPEQIVFRDKLIKDAQLIVDTLQKEIEGFLPPIDAEVKEWVKRLFYVCTGGTPKKFENDTFSKVNNLSDQVYKDYANWLDISTSGIPSKKAQGVEVSTEYENWIQLLNANIHFFNLYFDAQQPDGGINHELFKEKALSGSFEYGPLRGGIDKVRDMTRFFGITREYSKKPENKRRSGEKEDFTDVIRREGLSYFHGNYTFVEVRGSEYYYSEATDKMSFSYANMARGYDELHQAILTGGFTSKGITYIALENKKLDKEGNILKAYKVKNDRQYLSAKGVKINPALVRKTRHPGLENNPVLLNTIPAEKRKLIMKDGKFDQDLLNYVFNMLRISWLDLAFVASRARGSSIAHGNGLTLGDKKVSCYADLISPAAKILYLMNNKAKPFPVSRLILMYKPEIYESENGKHPGGSDDFPMAVTEKAYDYFQYYLAKFSPGVLLGSEYKDIPASLLKIKKQAKVFFRHMLNYSKRYNKYNDNQRDGVFFHFNFSPKVGTEYSDDTNIAEFPDLSTAILRGYCDSIKNYYTAAQGFWDMTEIAGQDLPEKVDENTIKEMIGDVLSNYFGTYKIIKDGAEIEWIKKIYRLFTMNIINAYEENTTDKIKRKSIAKTKSAVMELIIPIASATTVKGMTTLSPEDRKDFDKMKSDLILDMYTEESLRAWEEKYISQITRTPEEQTAYNLLTEPNKRLDDKKRAKEIAHNEFWATIKDGARAEQRIYEYITKHGFVVHPRYFRSEREDANLDYTHHREVEENPGESYIGKKQRWWRHFKEDWGFGRGVENPTDYKLAKPRPPETTKKK